MVGTAVFQEGASRDWVSQNSVTSPLSTSGSSRYIPRKVERGQKLNIGALLAGYIHVALVSQRLASSIAFIYYRHSPGWMAVTP